MKKESMVIEEKNVYELKVLIQNTALMYSVTGQSGLINIKNNEIIGKFDDFYTIYSPSEKFYFQEKRLGGYEKSVTIYDALNEKIIADNWLVINNYNEYNLAILQDPNTKKYHLFQSSKYRKETNIFDIELDEVNKTLYNHYCHMYFAISKQGKKALYSDKLGLVTPYQYDNIERIGNAIVFTEGENKYFRCLDLDNENESPIFEEIFGDENNRDLLYCKRGTMMAIYSLSEFRSKLLFTTDAFDDIHCIKSINVSGLGEASEYIFAAEEKNKYGLLSGVVNKKDDSVVSCENLTKVEYDKIEYKDGNYFLTKNDKQGLFTGTLEKHYIINAIYDKVVPLYNKHYAVFKGEFCDIINIIKKTKVLSNCKIIINNGSSLIYEKNGQKGILYILNDSTHFTLNGYDDIEYLGYSFYLVTKNGKKGIIHNGEVIVEPKYKEIEINGFHEYEYIDLLEYGKVLYFALKKENGKYELAKYKKGRYSWEDSVLEYLDAKNFNEVKLYDSFMLFKDDAKTYIYSYEEDLIKTYPRDTEIVATIFKIGKKKINLYLVNGVYYLYKNNKLEIAPIEECELYITTYESDYGIVAVNSYDKSKHDEVCGKIESDGDENFDKVLLGIYNQNSKIQEKYPTLVKKIK